MTIGPITVEAIIAAKTLKEEGISVAVATMSSIRPLDNSFLDSMIKLDFKKWITLEEHGLIGGLGSTILEWISDKDLIKKYL